MGVQHVCTIASTLLLPLAADRQVETRVMESLLLIFAWGAGIMSLFLVGDMIAADFAYRRAERMARRHDEARRSLGQAAGIDGEGR
jgi:hypothetical protein